VDILRVIEEEVRSVLEGSDAELVLDLIKSYKSLGPKEARRRLEEALREWGVDVENLED
jgi:ATP-dependent helicase YprA (DUF1998 family)